MGAGSIQKILASYTGKQPDEIQSWDFLVLEPDYVMTHDNTGAVIPKFEALGLEEMKHPGRVVFTLDHDVQNESEKNLTKYENIKQFARRYGTNFYPAGRWIGHQIMCEEGYVRPGRIVVASDSHTNMYGAYGCLWTPIVRTDAAMCWATGKFWWQVPPITQVVLTGKLPQWVTAKDVIIALCGQFNADEVLNHALEFAGDGLTELSINERMTIANMTTERWALVWYFPIDDVTMDHLRTKIARYEQRTTPHARLNAHRLAELEEHYLRDDFVPDSDASYVQTIELDLATLQPYVLWPNSVKQMVAIADIEKERKTIDKAYLVSCVNSRESDLADAAQIVRDAETETVASWVEFYLGAASTKVKKIAEERGDWKVLSDAWAIHLPAACGPCIGTGKWLLEAGEVWISATNRNFSGRMWSRDADCYLASPIVVATSAMNGYISGPQWLRADEISSRRTVYDRDEQYVEISPVDWFPAAIEWRSLLCLMDNMNTNGIYKWVHTYNDDITYEEQAQICMEVYDPGFYEIALAGDIIVAGYNFWSWSSREQAATCLQSFGIQCVVAASFSETYRKNAFNNGFLTVVCPSLYEYLLTQHTYDADRPSAPALSLSIDSKRSVISYHEREFLIQPIGLFAQQLIVGWWLRDRNVFG